MNHHLQFNELMGFRDRLAKLRGLAGEMGYRRERGVVRDTWILTDEKTGKQAVSDRGTTAFTAERAIKFLSALRK